ncbi:hypothetical protein ZWY2020_020674 [Hordeum vulgare]|nr:hypothetical protein ZWY2020_020674 [Hordeum vulgare]
MGLLRYLPLLLLLLSASAVVGGESLSASDHEARFEAWCAEHGKTYATPGERSVRLAAFPENAAFVAAHNNTANSGPGGPSYTLALNACAAFPHHLRHESPPPPSSSYLKSHHMLDPDPGSPNPSPCSYLLHADADDKALIQTPGGANPSPGARSPPRSRCRSSTRRRTSPRSSTPSPPPRTRSCCAASSSAAPPSPTRRRSATSPSVLNDSFLSTSCHLLSYSLQHADCAGAVFYSIMRGALVAAQSTNDSLLKKTADALTKWKDLLRNYTKTVDEEDTLLEGPLLISPLFSKILPYLYDKEVVSEDAILRWAEEKENADESDKVFVKQSDVFIQWLKEAEEEEDDEDDEEEE